MGLFSGILSGLGGVVGDIFGAVSNAKSVKKASKAEQQGLQNAIAEQRREYDTSRSDFAPYMDFGKTAIGPLGDLLGLNGSDAAAKAIAGIKASPIFTSLFNTGEEATLQNASATGGIRGGNTEAALYDLGSNTLAQVLQQQVANLFGAAGVGQGATGSVSTIGAHTADQIGAADTNIGQVKAGGILGTQQVYNNLSDQISKLISSFMPVPGGGGGF